MPTTKTTGRGAKLTFVSISGPSLDHDSAKLMRAHTTKANFARRRQQKVQDYAERKERDARGSGRLQQITAQVTLVDTQLLSPRYLALYQGLGQTDSYFIDHCMLRSLPRI
jgi:hypothetical protein